MLEAETDLSICLAMSFCDTSVGLMDFTSVWKYHVFVDDMLTSLVNSMECLHERVSVAMFDLGGLSRYI